MRPMEPAPLTHMIPDAHLEAGLDYALALGVIEYWEVARVYRRERTVRWYRVVFPDGNASAWTTGVVAAFALGLRLASLRDVEVEG